MVTDFSSFPTIDLSDDYESDSDYAIQVENVNFGYNTKKAVLKNFTLKIVQGKIFALLGSNGCGKTTLLKLILGRAQPNSGSIRVFGLEAGHKDSNIPGPGVGYMPQEIALFNEFTINEILNYFGNIYQMNSLVIENRIDLMIELLNLPKKNRKISELSGGQQRLVSMAVTIIHRPKLLILDEPTVGVDSILRYRVWSYLESICQNYGTTVLITTHYIEEAKNASNVGFISCGSILKQSNPEILLQEFNCETLEEVFLKLCQRHYKSLREERKSNKNVTQFEYMTAKSEDSNRATGALFSNCLNLKRIGALLTRNYIFLKRRWGSVLSFFLIPLITIAIFRLTVGSKPLNIPIALYTGADHQTRQLSERYMNAMNRSLIVPNYYSTKKRAIESVVMGKNMYAFIYPKNYSQSLRARIPDPFSVSNEVLNSSIIRVYADHSNTIAAVYVRYLYFVNGMVLFLRQLATEMGLKPSAFSLPIDSTKPIFEGSFYQSETYPSAGIILVLVYLFPLVLASFLLMTDLRSKTLERTYVSGVKPIEVFLVLMIEMFVLISIQVFLLILIVYFLFEIPIDFSIFQVFILLVMQGLEGTGTGILFALIFENEVYCFILVVGLVLPLLTCSGVIWPLEAIPIEYRKIAYWTPITLPLESLRSLLFRRLTIYSTRVMKGFIVSLIYNLMVLISNVLLVTSLQNFDFLNFLRLKRF